MWHLWTALRIFWFGQTSLGHCRLIVALIRQSGAGHAYRIILYPPKLFVFVAELVTRKDTVDTFPGSVAPDTATAWLPAVA
jgi:hypothetical protein